MKRLLNQIPTENGSEDDSDEEDEENTDQDPKLSGKIFNLHSLLEKMLESKKIFELS